MSQKRFSHQSPFKSLSIKKKILSPFRTTYHDTPPKHPNTILNELDNERRNNINSDGIIDLNELNIKSNELKILSFMDNISDVKSVLLNGNRINIIDCGNILEYCNLEMINISENRIKRIEMLQDIIILSAHFKLKNIHISYNLIEKIPDCIGLMTNLEVLNASHNQIEFVSDKISFCKGLTELQLNDNLIHQIPVMKLKNLRTLNLKNNNISVLPDGLFDYLPHLIDLNISDNELEMLPVSMNKLSELIKLDVSVNKLKDNNNLYGCINEISSLKELYIHNNQFIIQDLLKLFKKLNTLTILSIKNNDIQIYDITEYNDVMKHIMDTI